MCRIRDGTAGCGRPYQVHREPGAMARRPTAGRARRARRGDTDRTCRFPAGSGPTDLAAPPRIDSGSPALVRTHETRDRLRPTTTHRGPDETADVPPN